MFVRQCVMEGVQISCPAEHLVFTTVNLFRFSPQALFRLRYSMCESEYRLCLCLLALGVIAEMPGCGGGCWQNMLDWSCVTCEKCVNAVIYTMVYLQSIINLFHRGEIWTILSLQEPLKWTQKEGTFQAYVWTVLQDDGWYTVNEPAGINFLPQKDKKTSV